MFHLAKWYLDVVTDEGAVIIAYAARLRWGRLRLDYASVLHAPPGESTRETSTFGTTGLPELVGDRVTWRHRSLRFDGQWDRLAPPFEKCLLKVGDGDLIWTCVIPRSQATVELDGRPHRGIGYVEHLSLTIPPWDLPFNTLEWGRHASNAHSVVWIAWRGRDTRSFIWRDEAEQPAATLERNGVCLRAGEALKLGASRDLCARPALTRVLDRLPRLSRRVAARVAAMFEHKMVAPSQLVIAGSPVDSGWSIFEDVAW
ncbi:MAG: hypothetical protein ACHQO8_09145 [Vicinamibacterales bacterium]